MSINTPIKFSLQFSTKVCPECGDHINEQAESYLQECDRCLSKKEEF